MMKVFIITIISIIIYKWIEIVDLNEFFFFLVVVVVVVEVVVVILIENSNKKIRTLPEFIGLYVWQFTY